MSRSSCRLLVERYIQWTPLKSNSAAILIALKNKETYSKNVTVFREFTSFGDLRNGSVTSKKRGRFFLSTCGRSGERAVLSVESKIPADPLRQFLQHVRIRPVYVDSRELVADTRNHQKQTPEVDSKKVSPAYPFLRFWLRSFNYF